MNSTANAILARLLARGDAATIRESNRRIRIATKDVPAYFELTLEQKLEVHGALRVAERAGCIALSWDKLAGADGQVAMIELLDTVRLAELLGRRTYQETLSVALDQLAGSACALPAVRYFIDAWRVGKAVRDLRPDNVRDVLDAIDIVVYLKREPAYDRPLRSLSAALFGDSKRIERLAPALDVLTSDKPQFARGSDEVFASLGLTRGVMPMLFSGLAILRLCGGVKLEIPKPFIGVAADTVESLEAAHGLEYILTVENLSPFHEIARSHTLAITGLIIYTGGMPSPSWRAAYRRILSACGDATLVYHWGDVDVGGFRIAEQISAEARAERRPLLPHAMDPSQFADTSRRTACDDSLVQAMSRAACRLGWHAVADGVRQVRATVEQESLIPSLPQRGVSDHVTSPRK